MGILQYFNAIRYFFQICEFHSNLDHKKDLQVLKEYLLIFESGWWMPTFINLWEMCLCCFAIEPEEKDVDNVEKAFRVMDINKDGFITFTEFKRVKKLKINAYIKDQIVLTLNACHLKRCGGKYSNNCLITRIYISSERSLTLRASDVHIM